MCTLTLYSVTYLTVLQRVLQREHRFESQKFHVSLYYKELGLFPPSIDGSSRFEAVPSDIAVDCAPEIAAFVLHNQSLKHKVIYRVTVRLASVLYNYAVYSLYSLKYFTLQPDNVVM